MEKAIFVSADGHAGIPPALVPEYLEPKFRDYLPALQTEHDMFSSSITLLNNLMLSPEACEVFDKDSAYRSGRWQGLWDSDVRLAEMDREGVAAEFVYHGDFRTADLGYNTMNASYPFDFVDAGVRAFDRWLADTFGHANDRFLLVGPSGTYTDMDATLAEVE